ncbi:MAG: thiazole biosynthesis adenylyltransferase ThiF, partial [Candidatus Diapherotrites archaeon]|nr:thiazole biosynthesis adenylyltransferase ThiF [Candidatus Diapherotrites archaeon]
KEINSEVKVQAVVASLGESNVKSLLDGADIIVDGTDNFETRVILNDYCNKSKVPCVFALAAGAEGFVLTFVPGESKGFTDVFPKSDSELGRSCADIGVVNALPSLISSLQVSEVFKVLLGKSYCKGLIRVNLWDNDFRVLEVK